MSLIDPAVIVSQGSEGGGPETPRRRAFKFAATLSVLMSSLGLWKILSGRSVHTGRTLVIAAVALAVWSLAHPASVLLFRKIWLRVGGLLGRVNSVVLLTLLYLVIVTPLGLLLRALRGRSSASRAGGSYFLARDADRGPKHFDHPY
jgi:hypothetical protein